MLETVLVKFFIYHTVKQVKMKIKWGISKHWCKQTEEQIIYDQNHGKKREDLLRHFCLLRVVSWQTSTLFSHTLQGQHTPWDVHISVMFMFPLTFRKDSNVYMQYNTVPPTGVSENNFVVKPACDVKFDLMLTVNPACSKNVVIMETVL